MNNQRQALTIYNQALHCLNDPSSRAELLQETSEAVLDTMIQNLNRDIFGAQGALHDNAQSISSETIQRRTTPANTETYKNAEDIEDDSKGSDDGSETDEDENDTETAVMFGIGALVIAVSFGLVYHYLKKEQAGAINKF